MATTTIGYVPYSPDLRAPGDRRRFAFYARERAGQFDLVVNPHPASPPAVVFLSTLADATAWSTVPRPTRLVYEVIDSYFTVPRASVSNLGRGAVKWATRSTKHLALDHRGAMERMCRRADAVICSTQEQQETISRWCANVHIVLDYHGDDVDLVKHDHRSQTPQSLMWEGLPYTLGALGELAGAVRSIRREQALRLDLVTDAAFRRYAQRLGQRRSSDLAQRVVGDHVLHPWTPEALRSVGATSDLAVVPVDRSSRFAMGKPENRLLLLWRMGQCVVATRTPAFERAMRAAGTEAALCDTSDDWERTLRRLLADEEQRAEFACRGRAFALRVGDRDRLLRKWDAVLNSLGLPVP